MTYDVIWGVTGIFLHVVLCAKNGVFKDAGLAVSSLFMWPAAAICGPFYLIHLVLYWKT